MIYSRSSPLIGTATGTADGVMQWLDRQNIVEDRPFEVRSYLVELYRLAQLTGINPDILAAQAVHEADSFRSFWWRTRLNPCGLGITGDVTQDEASPRFKNGTDAARAHVVHMCAYVFGDDFLSSLSQYIHLDPRFHAVYDAGFAGTVRRISDLGNGKWATDPGYSSSIVERANQIFGGTQAVTDSAIQFGNVPYPEVIQSHLPASNPMVKTSGAPDIPDAVVWHRMLGTFRGTDSWFHQGHAATCYGVACAATDAPVDTGKIFEWIAPRTGWYGESSGPVASPYGDGLALVNKVGIQSVNRVSKAIEISGNYDTPLDEGARAAVVNMTAYWADQKHIPWDQFPIVPGEARSFVIWHRELTIGTGKVCPGSVVMAETSALIQRVKGVLKAAQTQGSSPNPPTYATPVLPDWWQDALGQSHPSDAKDGNVRYWVVRRNFEALKVTRRLSEPRKDAPESGPKVQVKEKLYSEREVTTDALYVLTEDGHFIPAGKLTPAVAIRSR